MFVLYDKCINMLVNFILFFCIRLGCVRKGIKLICYEFLEILKLLLFMYKIVYVFIISYDLFYKLFYIFRRYF